ncbi:MAG: rhodanese-like domain-containing protein [Algibacter sp.]|uniref:rhodanese-like domain-containing protein n=1 Tax=Algibacter sp. TaxID=1872428 RepID=UPI0026395CF1|nr:rhodanese-like domain-containing protein [Algibacter sp.]MDG1730153.1 rhodanese-like domain-containing protein [Algibacter sp.]MDG2179450.1 rhodanese-like domain-containing protein [Algibacter sp.]
MKNIILYICIGISAFGFSQKKLSKLLKQQNSESVPYISIEALQNETEDVILLDSREKKEFKTSHLENAIYVGYDSFNLKSIQHKLPNNDSKIVVYCSLGIRSEDIAEKLKKAGYTNVHNLYGGIFEWKNNDLEVFNSQEKATDSIHTFSKGWSKWLKKGIKVYE